ncbi:hypothetical protein LIER_25755 [Lithospermum erythrorhizon]|uniref:Uncharacterized protein n=1 Tax=Lithospermum erythrorhizon TaxID=34254 RepID=A0AAV3R790_LITER
MTEDINDPVSPNFQKRKQLHSLALSPLVQSCYRVPMSLTFPLTPREARGSSSIGKDETTRITRNEIRYLEGMIQSSIAKKFELEARLQSIAREVDLEVDPAIGDSEAEASQD